MKTGTLGEHPNKICGPISPRCCWILQVEKAWNGGLFTKSSISGQRHPSQQREGNKFSTDLTTDQASLRHRLCNYSRNAKTDHNSKQESTNSTYASRTDDGRMHTMVIANGGITMTKLRCRASTCNTKVCQTGNLLFCENT